MVSNGNSVTRYKTFHPLGWIKSSTKRTSGADFDFSYTYDLAGGLASVSYPSGKTVNYCADSAGRMTKATRDNSVIAQANLFWPSGLIRSLQYANGVTETVEINQQRQQITSITAAKGATQLLKLDYWVRDRGYVQQRQRDETDGHTRQLRGGGGLWLR